MAEEIKNQEIKAQEAKKPAVKKATKGMIFSRLDHAVPVKYNGQECMVSPNAKLVVENLDLLGKDLPKGLIIRPIS